MGMPSEQFVNVDGVRTRYFEQGQGEPLVLFHGGHFGSPDNVDLADNWDLNLPGLAKWFRVFAVDKLGQGWTDNPKTDDDYTMTAVVQHAYRFLCTMGLSNVHVVGHSRGGYLVTRLTLEHPELIKTLVIVDSGTTAPGEVKRGTLLANPPQPLLSKESLRWVTERFSATYDHITDGWLEVRFRNGQTAKYQEAVAKMATLASTHFLPHLLKQKEETLAWIRQGRLKTPTLLVWGKDDPSAILENGLALFDLIASSAPCAQMHIFSRAGHYAYREHPEAFNEVVRAFITSSH
jgi:2-hydroxy-6-oxonona-2,4-dienedioate hydrolase